MAFLLFYTTIVNGKLFNSLNSSRKVSFFLCVFFWHLMYLILAQLLLFRCALIVLKLLKCIFWLGRWGVHWSRVSLRVSGHFFGQKQLSVTPFLRETFKRRSSHLWSRQILFHVISVVFHMHVKHKRRKLLHSTPLKTFFLSFE